MRKSLSEQIFNLTIRNMLQSEYIIWIDTIIYDIWLISIDDLMVSKKKNSCSLGKYMIYVSIWYK